MGTRRFAPLLVIAASAVLIWPAASAANHLRLSATVSAQLKERENTDFWTIEIRWTASCHGASPGTAFYDGDLYMVDVDTGERHYVGGVGDASGAQSVTRTREWSVSSLPREQSLRPELTINCYESFPLHGGPTVTVTGDAAFVPPAFGGGDGTGGGGSGGGGDYGRGDPTAPLGPGGCVSGLVGTNGSDTLTGSDGGDVIFGLGGSDRIQGMKGHDCLIGGSGDDRLKGGDGNDRQVGGRGDDLLIGDGGVNAYDAGPGRDVVKARNGRRELVRCGSGRDRARVDRRDRVRGCERTSRPR